MRIKRDPTKPPVDYWPSWRYGPHGEAQIFGSAEEVPQGWQRKPWYEEFETPEVQYHDKDQLIHDLEALGYTVDPTWGVAHMKKVLDNDVRTSR